MPIYKTMNAELELGMSKRRERGTPLRVRPPRLQLAGRMPHGQHCASEAASGMEKPKRRLELPAPRRSTSRGPALIASTIGVVLLTPLILAAGLVAVIALAAVSLSRQITGVKAERRSSPVATTLYMEAQRVESRLAAVVRRAA